MVHIIFRFADGDSERDFNNTFEAMCAIVDAFNYCEDYFIGARFADEKEGNWINILDAEAIMCEVGRVREYLEIACICCFSDEQILKEIREICNYEADQILPSWRQFMKEYTDSLNEWIKRQIP